MLLEIQSETFTDKNRNDKLYNHYNMSYEISMYKGENAKLHAFLKTHYKKKLKNLRSCQPLPIFNENMRKTIRGCK